MLLVFVFCRLVKLYKFSQLMREWQKHGGKKIKLPRKGAGHTRLIHKSEKSATRQQALFYKGFVELFGWQHSGNGWQHVAAFAASTPGLCRPKSRLGERGGTNPTGRAERGPVLRSLAKEDWNDLDRTVK
jgi:hypothetical protein